MLSDRWSSDLSSEIRYVISKKRARWIFGIAAGWIMPFVEMAFIFLLYLIITPDKHDMIVTNLQQLPWIPADLRTLVAENLIPVIYVTALFVLLVQMFLRYTTHLNGILIQRYFLIRDMNRLISGLLYAKTLNARRISKDRFLGSLTADVGAISNLVKYFLVVVIGSFSFAIYVIGAIFISWQMLVISLLLYAIPFWMTRSVYDHSQKIAERKMESWKNKLGFTSDLLQSVTRSKIDALEETIIENARPVLRANAQWRVDKARLQGQQLAIMEGLSFFGLMTLMLAGLMAFDLSLSFLVVLVVIFNRLKTYANQINTGIIALKETYPHCKQYLAICSELGEKFEIRPTPSDQHVPSIDRIDVNQVDFEYEPDNPVLQGINFSAEAGDRILIQGQSGNGKSTFLELLCGILPPQRGEILYNGEPLDDAAFYRMRSAISYVAPTLYLFNDTLQNNLIIGTTGDEARLQRAVKFASLENVIADLPQGLDSMIGPDGENLSLGERQRVILGRVFMQNPQLIIFDEATANLNRELEQNIMEMLQRAVDPSCIIVVVAHKEPEGIIFNKRFVMDNGALLNAEFGPTKEFVTST